MTEKQLRVGIVGCGKIADAHAFEINATDVARVVAVCDREALMARQLAERFNIEKFYDDLQTMLRECQLDVLHIATPPDSHLHLCRIAFAANCHVFLEKPLALTATDVEQIYTEADRYGRMVAVNYLYNWESPYLSLQEHIANGRLGDVVHIESTYGYNLAGEYGLAVLSDPYHWVHRLPGKLFQNVLDHVLCKAVPLMGSDTFEATCFAIRSRPATGNAVIDDLPDELRMMLRCGKVTMTACISAHARPVTHTMRVFGTKDTFELDFVSRTCTPIVRQKYPSSIGRLVSSFDQTKLLFRGFRNNLRAFRRYEFSFFYGMRLLLRSFYESIHFGLPQPQNRELIIRTAHAIDLVITAARPLNKVV